MIRVFTTVVVFVTLTLAGCATTPNPEVYKNALLALDYETLRDQDEVKLDHTTVELVDGNRPLHHAVQHRDHSLIEYLLKAPNDINAVNDKGLTPLMLAVSINLSNKLINKLLVAGADPYLVVKGQSAFDLALLTEDRKSRPIFEKMLADGHAKYQTVLDLIKTSGVQENVSGLGAIKSVIEKGEFYINYRDGSGASLFYWATVYESLDVISYFLAKGANVDLAKKSGWTSLMNAAYYNQRAVVGQLIQAGANVNLADEKGWTALHVTVANADKPEHDYADLAAQLVKAGADINAKNVHGQTALFLSVMSNKPKTFAALLKAGANLNLADNEGWTPLMQAVNKNRKTTVSQLLNAGADVNLAKKNGWTALHFTVNTPDKPEHDYADLAAQLIKAGADINAQKADGYTPLHVSVSNNKPKTFAALLKAGANLNLTDNEGWTPLMRAVNKNRKAMVSQLLKAGADVNLAEKNGWTALHLTVNNPDTPEHDYADLAAQLVKAGADINAKHARNQTPLDLSVSNNKPKTFAVLLQAGANPNIADNEGWTPLILAANNNQKDMVSQLLNAGADVNLANNNGWTALHFTVNSPDKPEHDYADLAAQLIKAGADINAKNAVNKTPLYLSVSNNKPKTFAALLQAGANPNIADNEGWTPLILAANNNQKDMVRQLLEAGADVNLANKNGWTVLHFTVNNADKPEHDYDEFARRFLEAGVAINKKTNVGDSALMLAAYNGKPKVAQLLINRGADTSLVNWEDGRKSALDYAVQKGNYSIADMLRSANAVSGVEQAKYPSRPAAKPGYTTCNTRCNNGDCYRTYSDGRKVRFQAQQKFNPFTSQWEFDSGSC